MVFLKEVGLAPTLSVQKGMPVSFLRVVFSVLEVFFTLQEKRQRLVARENKTKKYLIVNSI